MSILAIGVSTIYTHAPAVMVPNHNPLSVEALYGWYAFLYGEMRLSRSLRGDLYYNTNKQGGFLFRKHKNSLAHAIIPRRLNSTGVPFINMD